MAFTRMSRCETHDENDPLDRALAVLEDDPDEHPGFPVTLLARDLKTGLPLWWPTFHPVTKEAWASLTERRELIREWLEETIDLNTLGRPLTQLQSEAVLRAFHSIASRLHSMWFDAPGDSGSRTIDD